MTDVLRVGLKTMGNSSVHCVQWHKLWLMCVIFITENCLSIFPNQHAVNLTWLIRFICFNYFGCYVYEMKTCPSFQTHWKSHVNIFIYFRWESIVQVFICETYGMARVTQYLKCARQKICYAIQRGNTIH